MRIVALDPSLTATGVADSRHPDRPFVIAPPPGLKGPARWFWIQKRIEAVTRGADLVVIEGYAHGAKYNAHKMGELGGILRLMLWCHKRPYVDVPPSVRMKLATGKGQATKDKVLSAAILRLGCTCEGNNEADARWLLEAALQHYELPGRAVLPAKHLEPMATARATWPDLQDLGGRRFA